MVMSFCFSMHFMYANLKVGSRSRSSCIFWKKKKAIKGFFNKKQNFNGILVF